jgi:hypothetical protein
MISPATKARLRLTVVALGLVPLALIARATYNGELMKFVVRHGIRAWDAYDKTRGR